MGWVIIKHSFGLVFRNFGSALRVSVGPIIIASTLVYLAILLTGFTPAWAATSIMLGRLPASLLLVGLIAAVTYLLIATWIAVAWHRFILLEDYPGLLPPVPTQTILPYIGKSFVIGLLMLGAAIPLSLLAGLVMALLGLSENGLAGLVVGFFLGLVLTFIWLRLAIILPGIAIARQMTIKEAWNATKPMADDVFSAAAILVGFNTGISILADVLTQPGWLYYVVLALINWFTMMVGISLLTTLYGHLIERRPLV